jgi:hypothetical protein
MVFTETSMSELTDLSTLPRPRLIAVAATGFQRGDRLCARPDSWTVRQICCHVMMPKSSGPIAPAYHAETNQPSSITTKRRGPQSRPHATALSHALETFRHIRNENYELLKNLPDASYTRTATHTVRGTLTLLDLLRIYAEHAENHARQIMNVRQKYKESKSI